MKRILSMTAAAMLGASMMTAPALAQVDTGTGAEVETGVSGGVGTELDTGTGAAMDGDLDTGITGAIDQGGSFDGALTAIGDSEQSVLAIETLSEVGTVNVVRIGALEGADMDALASTESTHEADIDNLHSAIGANAAVSAALDAEGVNAEEVLAAQTEADGTLTVFVR